MFVSEKLLNILVFVLFLLCNIKGFSQEIKLEFPYFKNTLWDMIVFQGEKQDTILSGKIGSDGKVVLQIPEEYKEYAGMARWLLRGGGGVDMVLNKENFEITCLSAQPNEGNIVYKGSPENDFLYKNYKEQTDILTRHELIENILKIYEDGHPIYQASLKERIFLENKWKEFRNNLKITSLYAARFREIVDLTRGIGDEISQNENDKAIEFDYFITNQMSWEALFTSNHWSQVIYSWIQMHKEVVKDNKILLKNIRNVLSRIQDNVQYTDFCRELIINLTEKKKDPLLDSLRKEILGSGKLITKEGIISILTAPNVGDIVPIQWIPSSNRNVLVDSIGFNLSKSSLNWNHYLVLFYQSSCGPCENLLKELIEFYPLLNSRGIRLVAVSGDNDENLFFQTASKHPWEEKLFDGKGFKGTNFVNFGVWKTPTLFILDKNEKILMRTSELLEMLEWIDTNLNR